MSHFLQRFSTRSIVCAASLLLVLSSLTGCAGYKLGPTNGNVAGEQTIQVNPFQNQTMEPRLSEYATSSLRRRLQQDGTYKLNTKGEGDIVVNAVITQFNRSELSFQPGDVRTVRDYYLSMTAQITAIDTDTGKTLFSRPVAGRTSIRVGSDLASAERQAIPLIAEDLARNATSLLVDGSW